MLNMCVAKNRTFVEWDEVYFGAKATQANLSYAQMFEGVLSKTNDQLLGTKDLSELYLKS